MATILIIDDDPGVSVVLGTFFERRSHHVVRAGGCEEGVESFLRVRPDLVLLDLRLPDGTGFDVLTRLTEEEAVIIMITGHADIPLAVQAMQAGAEHFLQKPVDPAHLEAAVDRGLEKARLRQLARLAHERRGSGRVGALLGTSPAMRELAHQVELLAATDRTTVLLVGETGTGKGRLAELIHASSPRAEAPFLDVSCVGMESEALEEELFGSEGAGGAGGGAGGGEAARRTGRAAGAQRWSRSPNTARCFSMKSWGWSRVCSPVCSSCSRRARIGGPGAFRR